MRTVPPALQEKLDSGATTLCRCYVLTRSDSVVLGFTDHDADIVIDSVACRAGTGLSASEATAKLGLSVDGSEISGALSDDALTEADLAAGRYDAATVETWLVDWSDPVLRLLLSKSTLGEVRRDGPAFSAELRSLSDRLNQESGRIYTSTCSSDLGDPRCGVPLGDAAFSSAGEVSTLLGTSNFTASGLEDFTDGWFTAGRLAFTGGANNGNAIEIKSHVVKDGVVTLTLWQAMPEPVAAGDTFAITAGCDKRFATCRDRFNNAVNFRGFPQIPGNDYVMRYPVQGEPGNNGKSLQTT
jgi:uncharacterized phage protein (TIGR02218 family)